MDDSLKAKLARYDWNPSTLASLDGIAATDALKAMYAGEMQDHQALFFEGKRHVRLCVRYTGLCAKTERPSTDFIVVPFGKGLYSYELHDTDVPFGFPFGYDIGRSPPFVIHAYDGKHTLANTFAVHPHWEGFMGFKVRGGRPREDLLDLAIQYIDAAPAAYLIHTT
jgi:hypothetical protein